MQTPDWSYSHKNKSVVSNTTDEILNHNGISEIIDLENIHTISESKDNIIEKYKIE